MIGAVLLSDYSSIGFYQLQIEVIISYNAMINVSTQHHIDRQICTIIK